MTSAPDDIPFDRTMAAKPGEPQQVSPLVRRLVANNGGPFTFTGTCTYVVGRGDVAVIDPGPADASHVAAIMAAVAGETVRHILVTHTHRDHAPAAALLKAATGAEVIGCPKRAARAADPSLPAIDAAFDLRYCPDRVLAEGDAVEGTGWRLVAVETPGHTSDHLAFALPAEAALFSGDHVMAWSTTVVAPPDGSMRAYMASLRKLQGRGETVFWPGHGGPVRNPRAFVKALVLHRQMREAAILRRVAAGDGTVPALVASLYRDLAPSLRAAAGLSVLAHLVDLAADGQVAADGPATLRATYART
ncbi:MBL fold metallo-hydrolase [Lichenibacterium minor]|jgi:glyoxylase-like metal-dependent hydrolase (beta-lactamase superfamily II)|uniref:MBL fold metallo-hydrolase n=1 Tax=Lichenibacterium minor TaxID=2316528 RepID=A0A4Q2U9G1_9HYPH|nr:MBL fold metallo-hydrolase [Lichenibacterium minor]